MQRIVAMLVVALLLLLPLSAAVDGDPPINQQTFRSEIHRKLYPILDQSIEAAIFFASELNISNGDPKSRAFGERYMFGRLMNSETAYEWLGTATDDDVDRVISETKRLLTGDLKSPGRTEYTAEFVTGGYRLDLETGVWEKMKPSRDRFYVIRVIHNTEYYGVVRHAYLIEVNGYLTLWRKNR